MGKKRNVELEAAVERALADWRPRDEAQWRRAIAWCRWSAVAEFALAVALIGAGIWLKADMGAEWHAVALKGAGTFGLIMLIIYGEFWAIVDPDVDVRAVPAYAAEIERIEQILQHLTVATRKRMLKRIGDIKALRSGDADTLIRAIDEDRRAARRNRALGRLEESLARHAAQDGHAGRA